MSGLARIRDGVVRELARRPYSVAAGVVLVVLSVGFLTREDPEWEHVFLESAARLWRGEDIYGPGSAYLYPPFMAWAHLPFLLLPPLLQRPAWLVVNLLCLAALLRWSWRLAGGGRLQGEAPVSWREHAAAIAGLVCGVAHLQNCLAHRQTDVVAAAVIAGGCLLLRQGRSVAAGAAWGVAAASKCTPLLWAPYLVWRGRLLAAVCLLAVAVDANSVADLIHTSPSGASWLSVYGKRWLRPLTASSHDVGSWGSDVVYNQSLEGAAQRWLTTTISWEESDCVVHPRPDRPSPLVLRAVVYGVELGLVLLVLVCCGRPFRPRDGDRDWAGHGLECGIVVTLMLLFSPMSSKAHFGILVLPGFCLARAAICQRSRILAFLVGMAAFLGLVCTKDPLGERLYTLSLWCGASTWQTLFLLAGCVVAVRRIGRAEPAALPGTEPGNLSPAA